MFRDVIAWLRKCPRCAHAVIRKQRISSFPQARKKYPVKVSKGEYSGSDIVVKVNQNAGC